MASMIRHTTSSAAGLLVVAAQFACSSAPRPSASQLDVPVAVSVQAVAGSERPDRVEVGGVVQARTTAALTSRILAPVVDVRVTAGDRVRSGDVLVVLDSRDLAAAARRSRASADAARQAVTAASAEERAAQASLRLARVTHERVATLAAKRSATAQELDEAAAALAAAEARAASGAARALEAAASLESATAASETAAATESFTEIIAPFDGLITEKRIDAGNTAMPGVPLLMLEDTGAFRLDVRVDESRTRDLRAGDKIPVILDAAPSVAERSVAGSVTEIARALDSGTHTALVKIALPQAPWLRTGMFGRASFSGAWRSALTVPEEAVVRRGQVTSVFTVETDVARLRMLNLAGTEVISGLSPGELVIVNPPAGLVDGQRVRTGGR